MAETKKMNFDESMERLQKVVSLLEKGDTKLEESMELFKEGTKLAADCAKMLDQAELQVVQLQKGPDGAPVELPFGEETEE